MRVIVTGSRDWTGIYGTARIYDVLEAVHNLTQVLGQPLVIVHGDGPGADQAIDAWALRRQDSGVTVERFPASWISWAKRAGPIRNRAMIASGADMCIGFLRNASRGTTGTLVMAQDAGIPTHTVNWTEEEPPSE